MLGLCHKIITDEKASVIVLPSQKIILMFISLLLKNQNMFLLMPASLPNDGNTSASIFAKAFSSSHMEPLGGTAPMKSFRISFD